MAVLIGTAGSNGGAFAAQVKNLAGDEPFFEVWDEEIPTCTTVVAIDGSVLLFKEQREKGAVEVKRSEDGGKTWIPSAPFPLGGTGEAGLAELRDGRIYYNSRTHMRPGNSRIAWVIENQ